MRGYLRICPLLPLLLLSPGCGKHYKVAPVSGRVMMDNRPLANADVRFTPVSGKDLPSSAGVTDEQGSYELSLAGSDTPGAVIGDHQVTISIDPRRDKSKLKMMMESGVRVPKQQPGELIPAKYNRDSKLTCNVPAEGKSDANFDLKSK